MRTWNIAKYLARIGWNVAVVTPDPSLWRHVEESEKIEVDLKREGIQCIRTDHRLRFLASGYLKCWNHGLGWFAGGICRRIARYLGIDYGIGWIKAAERACSSLTAKDVDVILATGSPFAAFSLAKRLSDRLGRPYVLDYRDPWTVNPHVTRPDRKATVRKEVRLLEGCAAVTVVSRSWGLTLDNRFRVGKKLHVITNGYDPEELSDIQPYEFDHFTIVYTGSFYPPKRVISPVMAAMKRLKNIVNDKEWYFHYYGGAENHVLEEAKRFGVMEKVMIHGKVPRTEALSALRGAGVAVVITSVAEEATIEDKGIVTGKVFEALGLGTPILLVAPNGSDVENIIDTTGLAQCFDGSNIDDIAWFLSDLMFKRKTLEVKKLGDYAWPNISKKLDSVLRPVAQG